MLGSVAFCGKERNKYLCIAYVRSFARGCFSKFSRCCNNQSVCAMDRPASSANLIGQKLLHRLFLHSGVALDLTSFHQTRKHPSCLGRLTKLHSSALWATLDTRQNCIGRWKVHVGEPAADGNAKAYFYTLTCVWIFCRFKHFISVDPY